MMESMSRRVSQVFLAACAAGCALGDWLTVPRRIPAAGGLMEAVEAADGAASNGYPFHIAQPLRYQQVFAATEFETLPSPARIDQILFRADMAQSTQRPFSSTLANVRIELSTTPAKPDGLDKRFDRNFGTARQVVYSGPLTLSSRMTLISAEEGPMAPDIMVPLQKPFLYDPKAGNLLMEVRIYAGAPTVEMDALNDEGDGVSRLVAVGPDAVEGHPDTLGLVTRFHFTVTMPGPAVSRVTGPAAHPDRQVGFPIAGLNQKDTFLFRYGRTNFTEEEQIDTGLGPQYNGRSCAQCHNVPQLGGFGRVKVMHAARPGQKADTLVPLFSIPLHLCEAPVDRQAHTTSYRISIPLFGDGLIDAIPDAAIAAGADPEDKDKDGIRGRAARVRDLETGAMRVGRFGWKAQHASLVAFVGDAYRNEMGITNRLFPDELNVGVADDKFKACDTMPDPEDRKNPENGLFGLENLTNFLKFLGPVPRLGVTEDARAGEKLFTAIGCARCHTPVLGTAAGGHPALSGKPVALYSNLLLHDVGTGDGIAQGDAHGQEFRTAPLWGLRLRRPLMHDGRSGTVEHAIGQHGGEAAGVTKRYRALPAEERRQLLAFLDTL